MELEPPSCNGSEVERVTRIELALSAWEADVLPLNYTRGPPGGGSAPPYSNLMPTSPAMPGGAPQPAPVPLRDLLTTPIRPPGTYFTIVKAALAAGLAFEVARHFGPMRFAFLAPVVALFTVQGSALGTLGQGVQRVIGNVVGVALASVWVELVGVSWWSLSVALFAALVGARMLPLGNVGQVQVALAVLLTVAISPGAAGYGVWRVLDTVIGGLVGIGIGVLLPERPAFGPARAAQDTWTLGVAVQLEAVAAELDRPADRLSAGASHNFIGSSRALHQLAANGRTATLIAAEGVFFNPRGRREQHELARLRRHERALVRLSLQVRVLSLTVDQLYDRHTADPRLSRGTAAFLIRSLADLVRHRRAGRPVGPDAAQLRSRIAQSVTAITTDSEDAYAVLDSVSLLGRIEQLRQEVVADPMAGLDLGPDVEEGLPDDEAVDG